MRNAAMSPGFGVGDQGQRVIVDVLSALVDCMVVSSMTVTLTLNSGSSGKLMTPSLYVQAPKGPSLVPSGRRSMASVQSPSVPHFPTTNSLPGVSPLAGEPTGAADVATGAEVADETDGADETDVAAVVSAAGRDWPPHAERVSAATITAVRVRIGMCAPFVNLRCGQHGPLAGRVLGQ